MKNKNSLLSKLLCVVIVLAMALPVGSACANEGKKGSFWGYLFKPSTEEHNIYKPYDLLYSDLTSQGPVPTAKNAARYLKTMPEGKRGIDIRNVMTEITKDRENLVVWDAGTERVRELHLKFFEALKNEGAQLDYVIDDLEADMSNWSMKQKGVAEAIVSHPKYAAEIRPELEKRNFRFGDESQGELYYVVNYTKDKYAYNIWNRVVDGDRVAMYHNRAAYEPISQFYPDIKLANYGSSAYNGETKIITGAAHKTYLGGPGKTTGTHSSPVCYGMLIHLTYPGNAPDGYPFNQFKKTSYNNLVMTMVNVNSAVLSTDGKIMPWVGLKNWSSGGYGNFNITHYYQEFIFHLGLMNPDPFLIYNHGSTKQGDDEILLSKLFSQLDEVAGFEDKKTLLTKAIDWDDRYVLSGMSAGGRNVWRITPDLYTPGISLENFLIGKNKPTFQIGNQVIVFPEGSYIYTPKEKLAEYGYWVISPAGTYPKELRVDGIEPPPEPILAEDYVPTGYTVEHSYTKYNPAIHKELKQETETLPETDKTTESEKITNKNNATSSAPAHWAQKSLDAAVSRGILFGTDAGLLPDRNISRAEFITMLLRAMYIETNETQGAEWYAGAISKAKELGWLEPYDDGPSILSREETARIMVRAFKIGQTSRNISFTDIDSISANMKDAVLDAAASGMINGYPDGTFKPAGNITRAEAVTMILRCLA